MRFTKKSSKSKAAEDTLRRLNKVKNADQIEKKKIMTNIFKVIDSKTMQHWKRNKSMIEVIKRKKYKMKNFMNKKKIMTNIIKVIDSKTMQHLKRNKSMIEVIKRKKCKMTACV